MSEVEHSILCSIENSADEMARFAQQLVRSPSVYGTEKEVQGIVARKLTELGLSVDVWEPDLRELSTQPGFTKLPLGYKDRPDVVGTLKGSGGGKSLILNGHVDVVSPEPVSAWNHDPWGGVLEDGRLYGRGSCDMKGGMGAMIYAVKAVKESCKVKGDVFVESVIDEEIGGPGGTLATLVRGYRADSALLAEPFEKICVGSAGVCWFRVKILGKTEHAARSHLGVNAIGKAMRIYQALAELDEYRAKAHPYPLAEKASGRSCNLNIGAIRGGDWPSTVAGWAEIEGRVGWQPNENMAEVKSQVEAAIAEAAEQDAWMKNHPPKVEWYGWSAEASETDTESPIIDSLKRNAKRVLGELPELTGTSAADDARWFVLNAGIPAVIFGPNGDNMHGIDEYVLLEDLIAVSKIYALTILEWCGK